MTERATDEIGSAADGGSPGDGEGAVTVIDLREPVTRVRVDRDDNPFAALSKQERMRLIIRVLCEIVAYGEVDEDTPEPRAPIPELPDRPIITS